MNYKKKYLLIINYNANTLIIPEIIFIGFSDVIVKIPNLSQTSSSKAKVGEFPLNNHDK